MTQSNVKAPEGKHTVTPHIVVRDASRAADWYQQALGAEERSRIEVPGGKLMQVELWFGDSAVMLADEFPEFGVLSPLSVGGTAPSCTCTRMTSMRCGNARSMLAQRSGNRSRTLFGASAMVRSPTLSATVGASHSTCATFPRRLSCHNLWLASFRADREPSRRSMPGGTLDRVDAWYAFDFLWPTRSSYSLDGPKERASRLRAHDRVARSR